MFIGLQWLLGQLGAQIHLRLRKRMQEVLGS